MTAVFVHAYVPLVPAWTPEQWADALTAQLPGVTVEVAPHRPGEVFLLLEPADPTSGTEGVHAAAVLLAEPRHFGLTATRPAPPPPD